MDNATVLWLLEDNNPAVQYRTKTEILGISCDKSETKSWMLKHLPDDWAATKGMWYTYYVTALAESGLSKDDVPDKCFMEARRRLSEDFEQRCSDFMLLRALVMLGFCCDDAVKNLIASINVSALPDGGFLCRQRLNKLGHQPKSCYKANVQALLLLSECVKRGYDPPFGKELINYFLKRNIFYRSDTYGLVIDERVGWRTIDVFYPLEPMRVGVQNVAEAFSAIGYGRNDAMRDAWRFMEEQKNDEGKLLLSGTMTKSYLPKEKVGMPSKWAAFYMMLAEKGDNRL